MTKGVHQPVVAEVMSRQLESPGIFTLDLSIKDPQVASTYRFKPGQFNMLSLFGVGEIPISISSNPENPVLLGHTIREVGRVTSGFAQLKAGDQIGLRGPFGNGWPLQETPGKDVLIITGGLGCAPVNSVIFEVLRHREDFGKLTILQGVKHSNDIIWRERYDEWSKLENTQVLLAADVSTSEWPGITGPVTQLLEQVELHPEKTHVMMCGPEAMMHAVALELIKLGMPDTGIWLSLERSMHCAKGHCGHCQFGSRFVCRDGPVFSYCEIRALLGKRGF